MSDTQEIVQRLEREMADRAAAVEKVDAFKNQLARAIKAFMVTSSERVFNGSGKGYPPAGTIGNRTHILSERLKAGTEFKRLKKGHRPAPMPPTWTHILSYKPLMSVEVRKYTECWQNGQSCAERDMQRCTSASKDVEKCRFWRVMYMVGWDVRPREDSITKKPPIPGAFSI